MKDLGQREAEKERIDIINVFLPKEEEKVIALEDLIYKIMVESDTDAKTDAALDIIIAFSHKKDNQIKIRAIDEAEAAIVVEILKGVNGQLKGEISYSRTSEEVNIRGKIVESVKTEERVVRRTCI